MGEVIAFRLAMKFGRNAMGRRVAWGGKSGVAKTTGNSVAWWRRVGILAKGFRLTPYKDVGEEPFFRQYGRRVYLFQLIQAAFTNQATLFVSIRGRW